MRHDYDTLPNKIDDTTYRIHCVQCNKPFESTRNDAAFCSSTCRSRNHRKEKNRQKTVDTTLASVRAMLANMPARGNSPEFDACNEIIRLVSRSLNRVESK